MKNGVSIGYLAASRGLWRPGLARAVAGSTNGAGIPQRGGWWETAMPGLGGVVAGLINEETNPSIRIACGLVPVGGDKMHLISANMPSKAVRPYQDTLVLASVPGGKVDLWWQDDDSGRQQWIVAAQGSHQGRAGGGCAQGFRNASTQRNAPGSRRGAG